MNEVWVGTKKCGCLVAISFYRQWIDEDYKIEVMDLEEARAKLKVCKCSTLKETKKKIAFLGKDPGRRKK